MDQDIVQTPLRGPRISTDTQRPIVSKYCHLPGVFPILLLVLLTALIAMSLGYYLGNSSTRKLAVECPLTSGKRASPTPTVGGIDTFSEPTKASPILITPIITPHTGATLTYEVKELGIQFKIPLTLNDLVYRMDYYSDGISTATFSTISLANLDKATGGTYCNDIGSLSKVNKLGGDIAGYKQIGKSYYVWGSLQSTCSENAQTESLHYRQHMDLTKAFESIQRIE